MNYEHTIKAISSQFVTYSVPVVASVGPDMDNQEQLQKYVRLFISGGSESDQTKRIR
jgi:hypothetical protein